MTSAAVEKVLGDIHAILGESPEAVAAVEELRGAVPTLGFGPGGMPSAEHLLTRLLLALKKADHNSYMRGYNDAVSDNEENGEDDVLASRDNEEEP